MEDFIIREIDRLGEMLLMIARRLGLPDGDTPDYTLADVKDEFDRESLPFDLDTVLLKDRGALRPCFGDIHRHPFPFGSGRGQEDSPSRGFPRVSGWERLFLNQTAFLGQRLKAFQSQCTLKHTGIQKRTFRAFRFISGGWTHPASSRLQKFPRLLSR